MNISLDLKFFNFVQDLAAFIQHKALNTCSPDQDDISDEKTTFSKEKTTFSEAKATEEKTTSGEKPSSEIYAALGSPSVSGSGQVR